MHTLVSKHMSYFSSCNSVSLGFLLKFFFPQNKLLRQCIEHVEACRDLRRKIGIGGSGSSQKGSRETVLCV